MGEAILERVVNLQNQKAMGYNLTIALRLEHTMN